MKNKKDHSDSNRITSEYLKLNFLRQSSWLHSRWLIVSGVVLLAIILVGLGSGSSQASIDRSAPAVRPQKDLFSPQAFQFTGQGKLLSGSAETWIIGGVPILIGSETQMEGNIHPGDSVSLVGHITEQGIWVAESIGLISEEESFFSFAGPLESKGESHWQVAGITLAINEDTRLGEAISSGEIVLASFQVLPDNSWLAFQIQALSDLERLRTPTVTPTPEPTPSPTAIPAVEQPAEQDQKPSSSNDSSASQSGQVTVCHNPNHKKGGQTLVIDSAALSSHLDHGDTLGPCR